MLKIYRIYPGSNDNPYLCVDDERYVIMDRMYDFNGKSLKDIWLNYNMYIGNPKAKSKGFYSFPDAFVFNQKVHDILGKYLEKYGEFLPITVEDVPNIHLFNLLAQCDCIDEGKTIYDAKFKDKDDYSVTRIIKGFDNIPSNSFNSTLKTVFLDTSKIDKPLFFINDSLGRCYGPFCTSGLFSEDQEFYHICTNNNLQGIEFFEIDYLNEEGMDRRREFLRFN